MIRKKVNIVAIMDSSMPVSPSETTSVTPVLKHQKTEHLLCTSIDNIDDTVNANPNRYQGLISTQSV